MSVHAPPRETPASTDTGHDAIAEAHSHLRCTTFDLPSVVTIAQRHVGAAGRADRVEVASADLFADPLPRADVITMGRVLHDWNLEKEEVLVEKAYDALPAGGALVVVENLTDDVRRENAFGLVMSLNMLIEFVADFWGWAQDAGFTRFEKLTLGGPASAGVAYK